MSKSKHQKFAIQSMNRSDIILADYNPRIISEFAKRELTKKIKDVGLIEPLIVNRQTNRLVSGHQRIAILDKMEGFPKNDYQLDVSIIDVSPKKEKEINVFLNNTSVQGEWNFDLLADIVADGEISFQDMGFTLADMSVLVGDNAIVEIIDYQVKKEETAETVVVKDKLQEIKEMRKVATAKLKKQNAGDFYFVIVCENADDKHDLALSLGIQDGETYIPATAFRKLL